MKILEAIFLDMIYHTYVFHNCFSGAFPDVSISPQPLLTCQQSEDGCHGGSVLHGVQYIEAVGITDETCSPFVGRGRDSGELCHATTQCLACSVRKGTGIFS